MQGSLLLGFYGHVRLLVVILSVIGFLLCYPHTTGIPAFLNSHDYRGH